MFFFLFASFSSISNEIVGTESLKVKVSPISLFLLNLHIVPPFPLGDFFSKFLKRGGRGKKISGGGVQKRGKDIFLGGTWNLKIKAWKIM